ncbi:unnamed protein product [Caenorhabditis angaria]|uniref:U3 small nucleolar RNA-associated protein 20 N-terminal domain-containing protein n=1 Tax=Caenorhabditis angaria TaxID=860376 RepID=A0A9P1IAN2_9PELO|nr:unnamed protein product [Caenorhabditis angaria]
MDSPDEDELFEKYAEAKRKTKVMRKFLSFNERIEQMGGDNGRFSRKLATETSFETYFEDTLETWRAEDQGPDLESFVVSIQSNSIKTYAQLLHKADSIFESLCEHIVKPDCHSIPAFCGILSALARDLREKFNQYCWRSFEILINILDIGERIPENVEAAYLCLTVLVKVQATTLSKQLKKTFVHFLPLFASSRGFVRRFAAESYAYLLRKSSDLRSVSLYIVKQAYKTPHNYLSDGCALLFYTTYIGIAGTFHSNSSQYLRDIISSFVSLPNDDFKEFCLKILIQMIGYTIEYAKKSTYPNRFFYHHVLTKMLGESKNILEASCLMRLLHPCIVTSDDEFLNEGKNEFKTAEKVVFECPQELRSAIQYVVKFDDFKLDQYVVGFISETLLTIFNDDKNRLFSKDITLSIVEKSNDYEAIIDMLLKLIELDSFDLYLMPSLGKIADEIIKNDANNNGILRKITSFYAYLCSQRRPIKETIDRESRSNFFDLSHHSSYRDWLVKNLESDLDDEFLLDMLISWPWLFSQSKNVDGTENVIRIIEKYIKSDNKNILNSQVVLAAVSGIYMINKELLKTIDMIFVEQFIRKHNCCESSLLAFELFVKVLGVSKNVEYMNKVSELVYPAFLNSNGNVRLTALQILRNFKLKMKSITDEDGNVQCQTKSAFDVLFEAESSELINFRERLLHFRKLRHGQHKEYIPEGSSDIVEKIVLTELLSQFFVNFTPLWKGIHELLKEFAQEMNIDMFWGIVGQWIDNVNKHIKGSSEKTGLSENGRIIGVDLSNRSDFVNARIQSYNFFESIPEVAERRTRILSPLVLELYDDFNRLTSSTAKIENLIQDEEEEEENENEEETNEGEESEKRTEIAHILKALNSLLIVYSKFNAAKATYLEPKLLEMYEKLLSTKYEGLQKSALACICSYRSSILAQYRENLDNLIDEDKLRQTLIYFKLSNDEDDVQVIDEHRPVIVPILLRILHGKLIANPKKKGAISRRNGIIYVIGGCRSDELTFFFKLYFSQIYSIFGSSSSFDEIEKICQKEGFFSNINLRVFLG